jgi:hypothetical protein
MALNHLSWVFSGCAGICLLHEVGILLLRFAAYLKERYMKHSKRWAKCFQLGIPIRTNNHVESYHNVLKKRFLKRRMHALSAVIVTLTYDVVEFYKRKEFRYKSSSIWCTSVSATSSALSSSLSERVFQTWCPRSLWWLAGC